MKATDPVEYEYTVLTPTMIIAIHDSLLLALIHQDYRAGITILQRFAISIPHFYSMRLDFGADPVVVRGRFLLMTVFTFSTALEPISSSHLSQAYFQICPHLCAGGPIIPDNTLLAAIPFASNDGRRGSHQEGRCCEWCPTDFRVIFYNRSATLYVWQDLSDGSSPVDPYWRSHIWDKENNPFKSTKSSYEYGSVWRLYHS